MLGCLLLVAAGLKLYGLSVSAVPAVGWFAQPWVQLASAEWEIVLGVWLLSGAYPFGAWLAAVGTFLAFATISGYLGWDGVASCGCFGAIHASPWWAFGIDVITLALLSVSWPCLAAGEFYRPRVLVRTMTLWASVATLLFAVVVAAGSWYAGSPWAALSLLRGGPIAATPAHLDLGSGTVGTQLTSQVVLNNWSDRPIRVIGGTSDCSCVTHADLPVTIPPGESRPVTIVLRVPPSPAGRMTRVAELFTDYDQQPKIHLTLSCRVD